MKIVNLTPHDINIEGREPIKSEGICRCQEIIKQLGFIDGIQIINKSFGEVQNLPEPSENTIYIVSLPVAMAVKGTRDDCYIPGEIIRDEKGRIVGCQNLAKV